MFGNTTYKKAANDAAASAEQTANFVDSRKQQLDNAYAAYTPQDFNALGQQFIAAQMPLLQQAAQRASMQARKLYAGRGLTASSIAAGGYDRLAQDFGRQAINLGQKAQDTALQYQQQLASQYGSLASLLGQAASPGSDAIASAASQFARSAVPSTNMLLGGLGNILGTLSLNEQTTARGGRGLGFSLSDIF